jgi:hypothetical protein
MLKKISVFVDRKFQKTADAGTVKSVHSKACEISSEIFLASCGMNVRSSHQQSQLLDQYTQHGHPCVFSVEFVSLCKSARRLEILIGTAHDGCTTLCITLFGDQKKIKNGELSLHCHILPSGNIQPCMH